MREYGIGNPEEQETPEATKDTLQGNIHETVSALSDGALDVLIADYAAAVEEPEHTPLEETRLQALREELDKRRGATEIEWKRDVVERVRENCWILRKEGNPNPTTTVFRRGNELFITDPGVSIASAEKNKALRELADSLGAKVSGVLLTHSHPDHIGNMPNMAGEQTPIYLHRKAFWSLRSPDALLRAEHVLTDKGGRDRYIPEYKRILFERVGDLIYGSGMKRRPKHVSEGGQYQEFPEEPMKFDGYTVEVVSTPGHAPGEVSFWIPEEKVLVGGDLMVNAGLGRDTIPSMYMPEANVYEGLASLKKMKALNPELFIPTHGAPIRSAQEFQTRVDGMIVLLEKVIEQAKELQMKNPGMTQDQIGEIIYSWPEFPKVMTFGPWEKKTIIMSVFRDDPVLQAREAARAEKVNRRV